MNNSRVDQVTHSICQRGCRYVNSILTDKKARQTCSDLLKLNGRDQQTVLRELQSVMSVYNQTGSCEA